jgi:hypothetical protein
MCDVPFVVAAQERFTHAVQYLSRVALERAFPEQNGGSILRGVDPDLNCAPIPTVEHLVHDGNLLGLCAMQGTPK